MQPRGVYIAYLTRENIKMSEKKIHSLSFTK
jgi:hypothetical protein